MYMQVAEEWRPDQQQQRRRSASNDRLTSMLDDSEGNIVTFQIHSSYPRDCIFPWPTFHPAL